jgi:mRNA interferase RelE/StbE
MGDDKKRNGTVKYKIEITPSAKESIKSIKDTREKKSLADKIESLAYEPEKKGKPLIKELKGYYSVRACGQRYRIIFSIENEIITVFIIAIGIRKEGDKNDIYNLAKKLIKLGLIE